VTSEQREEALMGVGFANQLFRWEKEWKKHPPSKRLELRQKHARPLLERMKQWHDEQERREDVKEGSRLRRGLTYLNNQWNGLTLFLKDGSVPLHNNGAYAARGITDVMPRPQLCCVGECPPRGTRSAGGPIAA
jgi:transposase